MSESVCQGCGRTAPNDPETGYREDLCPACEANEDDPYQCDTCDDTGIVKFCPSEPDKCSGCEEMPCPDCQGGVR